MDPHPAEQTTSVPAPVLARYQIRELHGGGKETFRLHDDRLEIQGGGAVSRALPLDQVRTVHLKHVRGRNYRYFQCIVSTDTDQLIVGHVPRRGAPDGEGAEYTAFVHELLRALSTRPHVRFRAGSMALYSWMALGLAFTFWFALNAEPWLAAMALATALFAGVTMLWPARPRTFDPLRPPPELLPR